MSWKEFIFPACILVMIIGIPIGIVLWFNYVLEM